MEMNELCPSLLYTWMQQGKLPNFKALYDRAQIFETEADVADPANLEPWIQWYSVHTGLSFDQHRVFNLTDGKRAAHEDIYTTLIRHGLRVGSFASMNVRPFHAEDSFFVGDPWSEEQDATPEELNTYNRFVSHNVREYSNADNAMTLADYAAFVGFMARRGLSARTVSMIARQLSSEKFVDRDLAWRRVAILDRIQFDVFRRYFLKMRPQFATFFINSTAHLQHTYWRHMQPEAFQVQPDAASIEKYGEAILFGYQSMDALVGEFTALANSVGARLVFQTALSQKPFLKREATGGQNFYRLRDVAAFLQASGITYTDVDPTMTHQYMVTFENAALRDSALETLRAWKMADGTPVIGARPTDTGHAGLYFGCQIATRTDLATPITHPSLPEPIRFDRFFYRIDAIKSGCHDPIGALWIEHGGHKVHSERVSILDTFPTLVEMLGVQASRGDRNGRSLIPVMHDLAIAS
jgi:hypothetical protein